MHLAGPRCFMARPEAVADLLDWHAYAERWPDIPKEELRGSTVALRMGGDDRRREVLMHTRRVTARQAEGDDPAHVCPERHAAFSPAQPTLCKYALANDLWLGRWHPVLRRANENLSHQMLLALARIVTTKVPRLAGPKRWMIIHWLQPKLSQYMITEPVVRSYPTALSQFMPGRKAGKVGRHGWLGVRVHDPRPDHSRHGSATPAG